MKKAFSILEIIIVVVIISIILSFAITKFDLINENTNLTKLKADVALIQNGITNLKKQKVLKNDYNQIEKLDLALDNTANEKLFSNVLQYPLKATNSHLKEEGFWYKKSQNEYLYILNSSSEISFELKNDFFTCIKPNNICKELF